MRLVTMFMAGMLSICQAMQPIVIDLSQIIANLQCGNMAQAERLVGMANLDARTLGVARDIRPYLAFFSRFEKYRFTEEGWNRTRQRYGTSKLVRVIRGSGNRELIQHWQSIADMHYNEINTVMIYHLVANLASAKKRLLPDAPTSTVLLDPSFNKVVFAQKLNDLYASPLMRGRALGCRIEVDRHNLLNDAYHKIMMKSPEQLNSQLNITFAGEPGIDAGGPLREFFTLISRALFDPTYAFFGFSASGGYALRIHPSSTIKQDEWQLFRFAGRIMGLAIRYRQLLGTKFCSGFIKGLLARPIEESDMKDIDTDIVRSLAQIRENSVDCLCLTFSVTREEFDVRSDVELVPGGASIDVTDENREEYITALVRYHSCSSQVQRQMDLIRQGLFEIIPEPLLEIFHWVELQYLFSGANSIQVEDWKENTIYEYCFPDDLVVTRFWNHVETKLSDQQRADLLQFTTGSPFVPITGFQDLQGSNGSIRKFTIQFDQYSNSPTITSHACFNQLVIPRHQSLEQFEEYILLAIRNREGFGER